MKEVGGSTPFGSVLYLRATYVEFTLASARVIKPYMVIRDITNCVRHRNLRNRAARGAGIYIAMTRGVSAPMSHILTT